MLTSATLAVTGGFEYIRSRLGIQHARELVVPSHFDYESQAILYVPSGPARSARCRVLRSRRPSASGRCWRSREAALSACSPATRRCMQLHERLLGELEYPMLLQGTAPKNALLEEFRLTPNAVLFATASFWQGVDVQGEQLSCVIIDKPAVRRAQRSGGGGAHPGHRRSRRQRLRPIPGAERGHLAEAGLRPADSLARTIAACCACSTTAC